MEVLVSLSVISLLLAVVLPAVQRARERSRNVQCKDHLRQLGLAGQNHVASHRRFPQTSTRWRDHRGVVYSSFSPHVRLLPYLESANVYKSVEWKHGCRDSPGSLPDSFLAVGGRIDFSRPVNQTPLATTIPVFLCPSDAQRAAGNNYRACMGYGPGIFGPNSRAICRFPGNASGAFVNGRAIRPSQFKDGLSHTVLFSEQLIGDGDPQSYTPWTDAFYFDGNLCTAEDARLRCSQFAAPNARHDSYRGATWLLGGWRHSWYNHVLTPNSHIPDCSAGGEGMSGGGNGAYAARSYHDGGVNVVLADGASHFISENINPAVWRALATRDGKEGTGDSF